MNNKIQLNKWDAAKYLTSEQDVTEFLEASMREADSIDDDNEAADYFISAVSDAARAEKKMSDIAERTKMNRTSVYRSLKPDANPSFRTVLSALRELGANFVIVPLRPAKA